MVTVQLSEAQKAELELFNQQQKDAIESSAVAGAISPDEFVYFAAFDGTNDDRDNLRRSGNRQETNVAQLERQVRAAKLQSSATHIESAYFPGVRQTITPETWVLPSITRQIIAIATSAYEDFRGKASAWLEAHPGGRVSAAFSSYSRGTASAAIFSQLLYKNGLVDPLTKEVLIAPGEIGISAGIAFDPVLTGVTGNLAFAPSAGNI